MANPYLEEIEERCLDKTSLSPEQLLRVIASLEKIRILLGEDHLYTQRADGLAKGTSRKDPLDCPFVIKALIKIIDEHSGDLEEVSTEIGYLDQIWCHGD